MRWTVLRLFAAALALGAIITTARPAGESAKKPPAATPQRVVIPFDFESKFDDGHYGQAVGEMFWKKLQRQGGFTIPESMLDVREWSQRNRLLPGPDTPLDKMRDIVRKEQGGDVGIWGKVERVEGFETDVYDLWINIVDFSADPIQIIYQKKVRTKTVSEIPHTYVKEALDQLYGRGALVTAAPDPGIQARWEKGPNLVRGDFEQGHDGPAGWDPLPRHVSWIFETGSKQKNRIVRFSIPKDVAESTGVLYYSDYFPVEEGAVYRFQCRWRSTGSAVKVFIKGYDEVAGDFGSKRGTSASVQRREVYRSQQNLKGGANTWNVQTEDFTPKHTQYTPRWGRVMLYAYYPAGTVDWDDIVVKQIIPPPSRTGEKDQRPSLETKVRTKDIK